MPVYVCIADPGLPEPTFAAVAAAIANVHCSLTGAPIEFVHVPILEGRTGGGLRVLANVRSGRSEALVARMRAELDAALRSAIDDPRIPIRVELSEIEASWVMEGGEVLPEPGEEADWLKRQGWR